MMGFGLMALVRRSLRQHLLSTVVTVVSVGLAAGLTMSVFAINHQTYEAFTGGSPGFDAVLGARVAGQPGVPGRLEITRDDAVSCLEARFSASLASRTSSHWCAATIR